MNHCVHELSYYSQQGKQIVQMLLYYVVKLSSDPTPYVSIDLDTCVLAIKQHFMTSQ